MPAQVCLPVSDPSEVGVVRRLALRMAEELQLPAHKCGNAAIIASEMATNLARHARSGQVFLQPLEASGDAWLEIVAVDAGPGIDDLRRCLQDGYSTGGTAGNGFGAIRRLSDEFDAYSTVGRGTVVLSRLRRGEHGRGPHFRFGAMSRPAPREEVCGDTWRIAEVGQQLAILVADGLGHGPLAAEAAQQAAEIFTRDPFTAAADFYARAHAGLQGTRGAAMARALIDGDGRVDYAGVGNIASSLIGVGGSRGLASQNGTVGAEMRRQVATLHYEWPERGVLLMHSDGITSRWALDEYPGLLVRHPALIAAIVCRDFLRGRDDATVVVVSRSGEALAA